MQPSHNSTIAHVASMRRLRGPDVGSLQLQICGAPLPGRVAARVYPTPVNNRGYATARRLGTRSDRPCPGRTRRAT